MRAITLFAAAWLALCSTAVPASSRDEVSHHMRAMCDRYCVDYGGVRVIVLRPFRMCICLDGRRVSVDDPTTEGRR